MANHSHPIGHQPPVSQGSISPIWYMVIFTFINMPLSTPPPIAYYKTKIYSFWDLSQAPYLHALHEVPTDPPFTEFDAIKCRARNDSRGFPTKTLTSLRLFHENSHIVIPFPNFQRLSAAPTPWGF